MSFYYDITAKDREIIGELEELPEAFSKISEVIGVSSSIELINVYGGNYLYVPKPDALKRIIRDRRVYNDFTGGSTAKDLAKQYKLSVVQIYEIIKREQAKIVQKRKDKQSKNG